MINCKRMEPIGNYLKPRLATVVLLHRLACIVLLLALASCGGGNTLATLSPSPTPSPIPAPSPILSFTNSYSHQPVRHYCFYFQASSGWER